MPIYQDMISEILYVSNLPTDSIDDKEHQDYQHQMAQYSLDYFCVECNDYNELKALKAVADAFHYDTKNLDTAMAIIIKKNRRTAQFKYDFEMATHQIEKQKSSEMENLFIAYEMTKNKL